MMKQMKEGSKNPCPLISVVIPTYNRAHYLGRAIKSVIDQTYSNWEIIVVDNHSVDNTDTLVDSFREPRLKLLKIHNQGVIAASRNKGVNAAKGSYIAFLDSDDWWLPTKVSNSIEALENGADVVYHKMLVNNKNINVNINKYGKKVLKTKELFSPVYEDLLFNGNLIANSSVVVRKSLLEDIGGISEDQDLITAEDYDLWLRISKKSEKFKFINKCLGWYQVGDNNTSNAERSERSIKKICEIYLKKEQNYLPVWVNYALSKHYVKMKLYKKARHHAVKTISKSHKIDTLIKAMFIYFLAVSCQLVSSKTKGRII